MSDEGVSIQCSAMSTSPTGTSLDPPQKKGLNSNAPTYLRGDTSEEDRRRLLEAEYYRTLNQFRVALAKQHRRKQQREERAKHPPVQRRPVGSTSNYKIDAVPEKSSNTTTNTDMIVLGVLDMGRLLQPAKLVAFPMNMPYEEFEGKYLDLDAIGRKIEMHEIERARDEYEKAKKVLVDYYREQSDDRARDHLNYAANLQVLCGANCDESAKMALENAQKEIENHAKQVLELHEQTPGDPSDESFKTILESLSDTQLFEPKDNSVAKDLEDALSKHPDIGYIFEPKESSPERIKHIYIVKKKKAENVMAIHTVVKGDTLSKLAQRYYGDMHAWQIIFETNRSIIKDEDLIEPGWRIKIPFRN